MNSAAVDWLENDPDSPVNLSRCEIAGKHEIGNGLVVTVAAGRNSIVGVVTRPMFQLLGDSP